MLGGGLQGFSVSPSPLGTNLGFELGWVWGIMVLGQDLTIILILCNLCAFKQMVLFGFLREYMYNMYV